MRLKPQRRTSPRADGTHESALRSAVGQLTLIEHCLCPLDARKSLTENFVHKTSYSYSKDGKRKRASVRVSAPGGLTPEDEFYLWGLLSLTLSQPKPSGDLRATRHYCLQQLGKIDSRRRGGRQYQQLAESLERLSQVSYRNDAFYDPNRGEHRRVSFGFLSYSLPLDLESSRAWHIAWDPIFFEFCLSARSMLAFDFDVYSQLDPASRRLFLLLHKLFWRYRETPTMKIRELSTNVLGFSDSLSTSALKTRISNVADRLRELGVLAAPPGALFTKLRKGEYTVQFIKGAYFDRPVKRPMHTEVDSSLTAPLRSIGFKTDEVRRIVRQFDQHLVEQWSDVTLAAMEHKKPGFFKRSPQAFFMHNVQVAAQGKRTPPDWWLELRKNELRSQEQCGVQTTEKRRAGKPAPVGDILSVMLNDGAVVIPKPSKSTP